MSTQANNNALALHEILLSISDSLNEAQNQLRNMPPYDQFGRPNTLYQLPYLDFSLEVLTETSTTPSESGKTNRQVNVVSRLLGSKALKFSPIPVSSQEIGKSSNKITSTISGRFVAVMPNDGMPQILINCKSKKIENSESNFKIITTLQLTTGDPVEGKRVEINYDKNNTESLNALSNIPFPIFTGNIEGYTDNKGEFTTEILLPDNTSGEVFIFVVNCGTIFTSLALSKS